MSVPAAALLPCLPADISFRRVRVLCNSFAKAMKDNFMHCRCACLFGDVLSAQTC